VLSAALIGGLGLAVPATAVASPSGVVISQLRLRTATSQYDEYVEIANRSGRDVDLSGWQLYDCYTSGGTQRVGTDGDPLAAGTTLPAGRTFVFGKDRGDYTGVADASYGFQVTEAGGFQLRDGGGTIQDGVGAAGTACAEGAGLAFPSSGADFTFTRTQDTDDNAADFDGPSGAADGTPCGAACAAPPAVAAIHDLQGSGATTPRSGQTATISGVVVGVDNQEGVANYVDLDPRQAGIYVEAPAADQDGDPSTSEAIFVGGLSAADRAAAHIGQSVRVTGKVGELFNLTWLDATGQSATFGAATQLPEAVTIDPAQAAAQAVQSNGTRSYYESLEGMRVRLARATADSGGTNRFGELFLRPGDVRARVFRDPGEPAGPADLIATSQDAGSAGVDPANPSRNPDSTTRVNADLFAGVQDVVGPLSFTFSNYKIVPQPGAMPQVGASPVAYPPPVPHAPLLGLRIAQFNVENLFGVGMTDDGHTFTAQEVDAKTTRIADAIATVLKRPDIVAVEEVADRAALAQVARKLGGYTAYWEPSTDARHIAVGFLVRRRVLQVVSVKQIGRDATTDAAGCNDDGSGNPKTFERPPLELEVRVPFVARFTLIANHWGSQGHPEACRQAQAQFVHDEVASLEAAGREVVVMGDLNDFEDSPALADLVAPGVTLQNLWSLAPADERYSYQYNGQLQTLDHVLMTDGLRPHVRDFRYVHLDNDYYERDDTHTAAGLSDHDAALATLSLLPRVRTR
jgi:predicted extracellular nuclease